MRERGDPRSRGEPFPGPEEHRLRVGLAVGLSVNLLLAGATLAYLISR